MASGWWNSLYRCVDWWWAFQMTKYFCTFYRNSSKKIFLFSWRLGKMFLLKRLSYEFFIFSPLEGVAMETKDECLMHSHVKILSLSVRAIFLPCRLMNGKFSSSDGNVVHFWLGLRMNGFAVMWASAAFLSFTKKIKIDFRVWTSSEQVRKCLNFEGFAWLLVGAANRKIFTEINKLAHWSKAMKFDSLRGFFVGAKILINRRIVESYKHEGGRKEFLASFGGNNYWHN